ncbi:MAG: PrpF family protein [Betaproteobacteria bacterium RIFCSPLOWO2_02_FULL_67_26]|nr:MAG: PrpF family protein [Betaproteobacteria bacterium RIFCSPLOWO2_02_FULL_67_26]
MKQLKIPAVFMRGGTSNAVVVHARDLPADRKLWDEIFLAAIGSPDPYGRQLDGMGGGVSSLSKVCVIGPPTRPDADIDYTFAQVQVKEARVDYGANCGNMSAAMGPFAVDEGLVTVSGREALIRVHNTNTKKIIWSRFPLDEGAAAVDGDLEIPGVAGTGAPVKLEFREPGGATTGKLLPTGNVTDTLDVPGVGRIRVSMVDAANACVFARAEDLGIKGTELPDEIEGNPELLKKLSAIRVAASVAMGITKSPEEAAKRAAVPFVGFVSAPQDAKTLTGDRVEAAAVDLTARMMSNGQPHRALPLTCTLCLAVAARMDGTVVNAVTRPTGDPDAEIRIGMPSGVLTAAASVRKLEGQWFAEQGAFYRTQRRLFDGQVYVRASRVPKRDSWVVGRDSTRESG